MTDTHDVSLVADVPGDGQFFLQGNYAPVPDELTADNLSVTGTIPPELDGWYLRNGPNPRKATGHWFTGDGMIHGVRIEGGRAKWYRNRWVRTDSFVETSRMRGESNGDGGCDTGLLALDMGGAGRWRAATESTHASLGGTKSASSPFRQGYGRRRRTRALVRLPPCPRSPLA